PGPADRKDGAPVAAEVRPLMEGSRMRGRRAARTFAQAAATRGGIDVWARFGSRVLGYQVFAVLDARTRPAHRARDGTQYFVDPKPGEKGLDECQQPPYEADGSLAYNCRCTLVPIMRQGG